MSEGNLKMDLNRLYEILLETTQEYRKGAVVEGDSPLADALRRGDEDLSGTGGVAEIYMMPPVTEAPDNLELVDCEFLKIGVDKAKAEPLKNELIALLKSYDGPHPLTDGPSYIEVGAVIGDQSAAFSLFALGKALGIWGIITPQSMGFTGDEARQMAGSGFIMIGPSHATTELLGRAP
jgi:hypothetical protein